MIVWLELSHGVEGEKRLKSRNAESVDPDAILSTRGATRRHQ